MAKAKEIMTKNPMMVGSGDSIQEVVDLFLEKGISSSPVITPLGEIIGVITELGLVKCLVLSKADDKKNQKIIHLRDMLEPCYLIDEEDHVSKVLSHLMRSKTHRVLVNNKHDKIVGIISPKDVLRALRGEGVLANTVMEELKALTEEVEGLRGQLKEMSGFLSVYDSIFQSGLFGLHSSDRTGKIIFCNEQIHKMLGYDPGELLGKTIFDIYPPTVHEQARPGLGKMLSEGSHRIVYSSMVSKEGEVFRMELASSALKDETGKFAGTFTISRKIESEHLLRSLHGIREKDEDNDSAKDKESADE